MNNSLFITMAIFLITSMPAIAARAADNPPAVSATQESAGVSCEPIASPMRSVDQIKTAIDADTAELNQVLPNFRALENASQRATLARVVVPALRKVAADYSELATIDPGKGKDYLSARTTALAMLTVLGDKDASLALTDLARSPDLVESQNALFGQLVARWMLAITDPAAQTKIIDDLEKLDAAHPDSEFWTWSTAGFIDTAATPRLRDRLLKMALAMNNPAVAAVRRMVARQQKIVSINENKPFVLTGKTVDGVDFSTLAWKGKVILVDFWATWCGPCVGQIPQVKKMYAEYHARGLEVVGVSNDFSASALKDFISRGDMPWPELYDPAAADKKNLHPLTTNLGIEGIPHLFLIDKQGICRTVSADDSMVMEDLIPRLLAEPAPGASP
jgi:thiol-disulfide isomerase/thioredoxin